MTEKTNPQNCVHCGRPAAGGGVYVGYDEHGNRAVACVPTCPKPQTRPETSGETR
jgi:ferredoxin